VSIVGVGIFISTSITWTVWSDGSVTSTFVTFRMFIVRDGSTGNTSEVTSDTRFVSWVGVETTDTVTGWWVRSVDITSGTIVGDLGTGFTFVGTVNDLGGTDWDISDFSRRSFWWWDDTFWWVDSSGSTSGTVIGGGNTLVTLFRTSWTMSLIRNFVSTIWTETGRGFNSVFGTRSTVSSSFSTFLTMPVTRSTDIININMTGWTDTIWGFLDSVSLTSGTISGRGFTS
jgi:hypothetical protein